jgi:malate/lactate dehydrogenase
MSARIAIVGAGGGVGSSVAFNLLLREEGYAIDLVDGRSGMTTSHEMDLQQVVAAGASGSVRTVELADVAQADVVVVSASVPLTVNHSRSVYLRDNAAIVASVADALGDPATWPGILLVVTNPVDALCTWLHRRFAFDRRRLLGYTANDSLRLRTAVGSILGVPSSTVDAWVIGEHGDGCVPLVGRLSVDRAPVRLTPEQRATAERFVRGWYVRHVALDSGRSSTWTTGHGVARMIGALSEPTGDPWPASVVLDGEYGISGVSLGVPVSLGPGGVARVHEWELAPGERAALGAAAEVVAAAAGSLGG